MSSLVQVTRYITWLLTLDGVTTMRIENKDCAVITWLEYTSVLNSDDLKAFVHKLDVRYWKLCSQILTKNCKPKLVWTFSLSNTFIVVVSEPGPTSSIEVLYFVGLYSKNKFSYAHIIQTYDCYWTKYWNKYWIILCLTDRYVPCFPPTPTWSRWLKTSVLIDLHCITKSKQ
jgi:hypothetical protein